MAHQIILRWIYLAIGFLSISSHTFTHSYQYRAANNIEMIASHISRESLFSINGKVCSMDLCIIFIESFRIQWDVDSMAKRFQWLQIVAIESATLIDRCQWLQSSDFRWTQHSVCQRLMRRRRWQRRKRRRHTNSVVIIAKACKQRWVFCQSIALGKPERTWAKN